MSLHTLFHIFLMRLRKFTHSESGMTLPLMAISMVVMTGMVGIAIDTARAQLVQSKLQFSLDAAGLAGGSTVSTSNLTSEVTKYMNANFNGYLGSTITSISATPDSTNTIITLAATATLPSTFMNVLNIPTLTVSANSTINRSVTGLELVLVLDNTGSMANSAGGGVSKISALQTAANALVNTLFNGQATAPKNLYVGIVPFSQTVNIGTSHTTWMDTTYDNSMVDKSGTPNSTDWGPGGNWGGCVDARSNSEDVVDDPPSSGNTNTLFRQYYWYSDSLNPDLPGVTNSGANNWKWTQYSRCKPAGKNCTTVKTSSYSSLSSCQSGGYTCTLTTPGYSSPLNTTSRGPNYLCPQQVTPMTTDKATLTTAINAMAPQGNTEINAGLEWGWNMISPRWNGLWGGQMATNNLPLPYHTTGMNKAIVLLTDGENTIDNSSHGSYWFVGDNKLGTTNATTAVNTLNARTLQLCTAMKNQGIYIYTIALGTDTTPTSLALLQNCATASNYYFNSPSTTQLQGVFNSISDSLSNLRVSQ